MKWQPCVCRPSPITSICRRRSQTAIGLSCSRLPRCLYHFNESGEYTCYFCDRHGDRHLWQAGAVLDSCDIAPAQIHTFTMWVQYTLMWTMLNDPLAVRQVKVIFNITFLTVFSSWWRRYNCCHIVWHNCGCCDTCWHTGNMESLQTISMERDDTHTFNGWTKYVIISLVG